MLYETKTTDQSWDTSSDTPLRIRFPFLDLMFSMQKAAHQALSAYRPRYNEQFTENAPQPFTNAVEVIPLGEETLNVEARRMQDNTVRVRRIVVETPVEKRLTLHEEKVIVERRKPPAASTTQDTLTEKTVKMTDSFEVVDPWKSASAGGGCPAQGSHRAHGDSARHRAAGRGKN